MKRLMISLFIAACSVFPAFADIPNEPRPLPPEEKPSIMPYILIVLGIAIIVFVIRKFKGKK